MKLTDLIKRLFARADDKLRLHGQYKFTQIRDGKIIDEWTVDNLITDEGKNHMLNVELHGATQVATWYVGIFEGNYTPIAGNVGSNFATTATECTAYDEATRPEYEEAESTAKLTTNSADRATFTINATKTIYGMFLISTNVKGADGGVLFGAARFASSRAVIDNDVLLVSYSVSIA